MEQILSKLQKQPKVQFKKKLHILESLEVRREQSFDKRMFTYEDSGATQFSERRCP
jgi:hypothetical protein